MGLFDWLFRRRKTTWLPPGGTSVPPASEPPKPAPIQLPAKTPPDPRYPLDIGPIPLQLSAHIGTARAAREAGNITTARAHYQRAADGFEQLSKAQNEALKQEIASLEEHRSSTAPSRGVGAVWPPEVAGWMMEARKAFDAGDIDRARMCYQKAAYGFAQLTPEQNEELKREIASFVDHDPRYQAGLALVRAAVKTSPGTLQSDLGKAAGDNREALNYVLYYAATLGEIIRVKSGRSYRLYLPGQPIPLEPEKPKRAPPKQRPSEILSSRQVEVAPGFTLTVSVQVRERSQEEIDEDTRWFTAARDWVISMENITFSDREALYGLLEKTQNGGRISKTAFAESGVTIAWPRGMAKLALEQEKTKDDDLHAYSTADVVAALKLPELRRLAKTQDVSTKGLRTKRDIALALFALDAARHDELRQNAIDLIEARTPASKPDSTMFDLFQMLALRISRAKHRMRRAEQTMETLRDSELYAYDYTHIRVDAFMAPEGVAPCGLRDEEILPAAEMLDKLNQPLCDSLDCCCSFSPHSPEKEERLARRRSVEKG